jgi:hypothetical protein
VASKALTLSVAGPFIELGSAGLGWYCMIGRRPSALKLTAPITERALEGCDLKRGL